VTVTTFHVKEAKVVLPNALTFMAYAREAAASPAGGKSGVIAPRLEWRVQTHANARKQQRSAV
jgi:hypothetical protein